MTTEVRASSSEPIRTTVTTTSGGVTGLALRARVVNLSTGLLVWNWVASAFQTFAAAGANQWQALDAVDAVNLPGVYQGATAFAVPAGSGTYDVRIERDYGAGYVAFANADMRAVIAPLVELCATASALTTVAATVSAGFAAQVVSLAKLLDATIAAEFIVAAGSTSIIVKTDATEPDGLYTNMALVIVNASGVQSRGIDDYQQAFGTFVLRSLPDGGGIGVTPTAGDRCYVLAGVCAASYNDVGYLIAGQQFGAITDAIDALATHGDSTWATATGFATSSALTTAQAAIDATNASLLAIEGTSWSGTTDSLHAIRVLVSALPTTAAPDAATIAAAVAPAVWSQPEGTPSSGTYGYGLKFLRMLVTNPVTETAGNPGTVQLLADDGTTVFKTWTLRDGSGGAVAATTGEPARRGAAT